MPMMNLNKIIWRAHVMGCASFALLIFIPITLFMHRVYSLLRGLQQLEGFGSNTHRRFGQYSLLHVDVKIFWQLLRILYSYPGLVGMRHDLFLVFGFWHAYQYAHIALWNDFRHTFLASDSSRCSLLKSSCSGPDYPKAPRSSLG